MKPVYAIVDCNNFYVSCERVFNPKLLGRPVVVLSNNDGCFVARSNEVKKLGIPMGAPWFKYKDEVKKMNCAVLSSNYALYGDMSARVMNTITSLHEEVEIYSIDEAFLYFNHISDLDIQVFGMELKQTIEQHTGIPVSIGFAHTKTLAKMANEIAKKDSRNKNKYGGVLSLAHSTQQEIDEHLSIFPIEDLWGIGRRYTKKLNLKGIKNAYQLSQMDLQHARKELTVMGSRLIQELHNIPCFELEANPEYKQNIASTRSFGKPVTTLEELSQSMAMYATTIGEKLRKHKQAVSTIHVFAHSSRFSPNQYYRSASYTFDTQTNYTPEIISAAVKTLRHVYRPGVLFKKAGIIASDLVPAEAVRNSLFLPIDEVDVSKKQDTSKVVDKLNRRYGKYTLHSSRLGFNKKWKMQTNHRTPRYTTVWDEMLTIKN